MMNPEEPSPYAPPRPENSGNSPAPIPPQHAPTSIKVFGIIHLVFAGLGLITCIISIIGLVLLGNIGSILGDAGGESSASALNSYMSEIAWYSYISTGVSLLLAILLLIAGIKLLKHRANALAWSNGYAWTSIITKAISLVVTLIFILPAASRMNESMGMEAQQTISNISSIFSSVASFAYPVIALILLNRPQVKSFFESRSR